MWTIVRKIYFNSTRPYWIVYNPILKQYVENGLNEIKRFDDRTTAQTVCDDLNKEITIPDHLTKLRKLMGYVENGTDTVLKMFQDDATKDFIVVVGNKRYWGKTLEDGIEEAFKDIPEENK